MELLSPRETGEREVHQLTRGSRVRFSDFGIGCSLLVLETHLELQSHNFPQLLSSYVLHALDRSALRAARVLANYNCRLVNADRYIVFISSQRSRVLAAPCYR
jgi:hypothetical protein